MFAIWGQSQVLAEKERCSSPCVLRLIFLLSCMSQAQIMRFM